MKRNPWPYAIVAYFILFISGVVTWIAFAVQHDDQLVRPDYYEHEMRYQEQIDRMSRASALAQEVRVAFNPAADALEIVLPQSHAANEVTGILKFYRPSEAALDVEVPLKVDEAGRQLVPVGHLKQGFWRVQLNWNVQGEEYFREERLFLEDSTGRP